MCKSVCRSRGSGGHRNRVRSIGTASGFRAPKTPTPQRPSNTPAGTTYVPCAIRHGRRRQERLPRASDAGSPQSLGVRRVLDAERWIVSRLCTSSARSARSLSADLCCSLGGQDDTQARRLRATPAKLSSSRVLHIGPIRCGSASRRHTRRRRSRRWWFTKTRKPLRVSRLPGAGRPMAAKP